MYPLHPETSIKLVQQYQSERIAEAALARSLVREHDISRVVSVRRSTGMTLIRLGESLLGPAPACSTARA